MRRWTGRRSMKREAPNTAYAASNWKSMSAASALEIFGHYTGREGAVVLSPLQTNNRWSFATVTHEKTHQDLSLNTSFGFFCQILASSMWRQTFAAELETCMAAQCGVQEGIATYLQMAHIAKRDPQGYDDAVSELPSEQLGAPPYREWFDRLADHLSVVDDNGAVSRRLAVQTEFVLCLGFYALNSDVLTTFPVPDALTEGKLDQFLQRAGPDLRLLRMIRELGSETRLNALLDQFATRRDAELSSAGQVVNSLDWLSEQLSGRDPTDAYLDNETRKAQCAAAAAAWIPAASVTALPRGAAPSAEVKYIPDWVERYPDAFPQYGLSADALRRQLALADAGEVGLACSIAMYRADELHLTTLPYPPGEDVNPRSWAAVKALVENPAGSPARAAVLPSKAVLSAFDSFADAPLWVDFIEHSWRTWDRVSVGRRPLRRAVVTCTQVELTEEGVDTLLAFRDIGVDPQFVVFPVFGQQYVACLFRQDVARAYSLQGLQGEAGLDIFVELAARLNIRQYDGKFESLPHALLLRLAGQGFLL